jgi:hypothetical protein
MAYLYAGGCGSLGSLDLSASNGATWLALNGCGSLTALNIGDGSSISYLNLADCTQLACPDFAAMSGLTTLICDSCLWNTGLTNFNSSNNGNLQAFVMTGGNLGGSNVPFSGYMYLTQVNLDATGIGNLVFTGDDSLTDLTVSYEAISSIDLTGSSALVNLSITNNNALSSLDITDASVVQNVNVNNNNLSTFVMGSTKSSCSYFSAAGNYLDGTSVDDICDNLTSTVVSGYLDLSGGTNASPTSANIANLLATGWTVLTN